MAMLLAEAGLVNEWCIRIFKMLHPAREDSQIYLFAKVNIVTQRFFSRSPQSLMRVQSATWVSDKIDSQQCI
jgi:cytidylate kinase